MITQQEKQKLLSQITVLLDSITFENETKPIVKAIEKPHMLTIKECVAEIDGLSEHTVRMLVAQGKLPSIRSGAGKRGKILVNKADLLKFFGSSTK